jgi:hypothetical protein
MTPFIRTTSFGTVRGTSETLVCATAAMLEQIADQTLDRMAAELLGHMDGPAARIVELVTAVKIDYERLRATG